MTTDMASSLIDYDSRLLDEELAEICGSLSYDSFFNEDSLFLLPPHSRCLYDFNSFESIN